MKAELYICGQHQGQIEVGENSLVAQLARGELGKALEGIKAMKEDIEAGLEPSREKGE